MKIKFTVEMISVELPEAFKDISLDELKTNLVTYLENEFEGELESLTVKVVEVIE